MVWAGVIFLALTPQRVRAGISKSSSKVMATMTTRATQSPHATETTEAPRARRSVRVARVADRVDDATAAVPAGHAEAGKAKANAGKGNTSAGKPRRGRRPRTVPVTSRDRARREEREAREARARAKVRVPLLQRDLTSTAVLITVVLVVLIAVAVPLRNYYEGRSEIARAQASIEALEQQKGELEADIKRYQDPGYVEQEARRRLGALEEGEQAWRIIDPRMTPSNPLTADGASDDRSWPEVLWDSLRTAPAAEPEPQPEPAE